MNVLVRFCALFCCLVFTAAAGADTRSEISSALDYYAEVWNEGDMDVISGYYHPDFVLITANGVIPLGQRIEDMKSIAQAGEDRGELKYTDIVVEALGEKHAMARGRIQLKFRDGSALESWFSTVYVNTPFGWKALLTHN